MGTDRYDYKETKESLWQIAKRYNETKLDDNFQRRGGVERGSGWTEPQSIKYVECLSDGFVSNKIMVAEVEPCLRHAISEADAESEIYFQDLAKDGYKYVSIDGNNSSSTINAYLSDEFAIYPYLAVSTRGRGKKKKKFSELTETEQNDIQHTEKLTYYVFRKIGIIEMCDLFRYENTSTKLNGQEYRQARWSELSKFIRVVANSSQGKAIFKSLMGMSNSEMDKRKHEEITAQFAMRVENNYTTSTTKPELDSFYENNEYLTPQSEKNILQTFDIVYKLSVSLGRHLKTSGCLRLSDMTSLFDMAYHLLTSRRDISISDDRRFFNWFVESLFRFREESKKVLEENQEEESYTFWAIRPTKSSYNNKMRNAFINKLIEDEQDLISSGVLSRRRTSRDSFSMEQACNLFDLQEGKLRDGSDIDFLDVMTAGKLEVDHVTSVRDGGTTELSNGELMSVSDNRSKGGKSNSPHFDHQDWAGTIFIDAE